VVYGHWVHFTKDIPDLVDPQSKLHIRLPDWVMYFQGDGPIGLRSGSGDVMVSVLGQGMNEFTAPVSLTKDDNVHSNIAAAVSGGVLHTLHLNGGPAKLHPGAGAGGGVSERKFELNETALLPDPAVVACRISDPYSAPGSFVTAFVDVENVGLAGTPYDSGMQSAVQMRAVLVSEDGTEHVAGTPVVVPELAPGAKAQVALPLEMPHDPVRLRVELNPSPLDSSLMNNWKVCFFGAPRPGNFACAASLASDEDQTLGALLTWTNTAIYDQVLICRDGSMIVALPGSSTRYVDNYVAPGLHSYSIRGRILASKSSPATCQVDVKTPLPSGPGFTRGDANSDIRVDISDAVFTLSYLFLGGTAPGCEVAADSNDDGSVNISDPSFTLNFLFLGGAPPPAPSPFPEPAACGPDPTPDTLTCLAPRDCQ
jgi:hypothetical protein